MANLGSLGDAFVTIRADLDALKAEVAGIGSAVSKQAAQAGGQAGGAFSKAFGMEIEKISSQAQKVGAGMTQAGAALTAGLTVPIAGLGIVASKAFIDFESAFAGVKKTLDGTPEQFAGISDGIREMAKEIPVSAVELSKLAAIGGQFGISTENILGFTRTIAELDVAVDGISGEEAAAGLTQFGKVAGVTDAEIGRLASSLVDLGNKGNSTEGVILDFAKRLAPAGASIGLAASEIMGLGAAMANLGINAEAGGTAMSQTLAKIEGAVARGGAELENFANMAGMSAEKFAETFRTKPIEAIDAFINGLGKAKDGGQSLTLLLDGLDMSGARVVSTLKALAQSNGEVAKQVKISADAFAAGNLHTKEAEERFKTAESQLVIFKNQLNDAAVTLGGALVPVLLDVIKLAKPLIDGIEMGAKAFAALPEPVKLTVIGMGGLLAVIGPIVLIAGQLVSAFGVLLPLLGPIATGIGAIASAGVAMLPLLGGIAVGAASLGAVLKAGAEAWGLYTDKQEQARLETAQNQSHTVAMGMASKIAGREITDLGEALHILKAKAAASKAEQEALAQTQAQKVAPAAATATEKLAALRAEVAKLSPATKENISANAAMGLSLKENAADVKLSEAAVKLYLDSLKKTKGATDEVAEAHKKLVAQLTGADVQKSANDLVAVITEIGGAVKLTEDETAQYAAQLVTANSKAVAMGQTSSAAFVAMTLRLDGAATAAKDTATAIDLLDDSIEKVVLKAPALHSIAIDPAKFLEPLKTLGQKVAIPGLGEKITADLGATMRDKLGPTIVAAFAGGGSALKAGGALLGNSLGESLAAGTGKALSGTLGKTLGGLVGTALGPLGSILGGFLGGKIGGIFSGMFGGVSKEVKQARADVADFEKTVQASATAAQKAEAGNQGWAKTFIPIRDAYLATGRSAAEAEAATKAVWESGKKGPEAAAKAIAEVNAVLDEAKQKTTALGDEGDTTFADMGAAASRFGIDLAAMGTAFHADRLGDEFAEALAALRLFERGGADMGMVLTGMSDELSKMVSESLKFGTEVPAAMRPYLESLVASGQLLDENGNKMTNLEGINFAETLSQGVDRMVEAVERLGDALMGVGADAAGSSAKVGDLNRSLNNLPREINIDIEADYSAVGDVPSFSLGTLGETGGWFGSFGGGTLAMLHGDEAVIRPDQAMSFALDQLGIMTAPGGLSPDMTEGEDAAAARERLLFDDVNTRLDRVAQSVNGALTSLPDMLSLALRDAIQGRH